MEHRGTDYSRESNVVLCCWSWNGILILRLYDALYDGILEDDVIHAGCNKVDRSDDFVDYAAKTRHTFYGSRV